MDLVQKTASTFARAVSAIESSRGWNVWKLRAAWKHERLRRAGVT